MPSRSGTGRGGDIAIVGWAQTAMERHTEKSETQLLMNAISAALAPLGLTSCRHRLHLPREL